MGYSLATGGYGVTLGVNVGDPSLYSDTIAAAIAPDISIVFVSDVNSEGSDNTLGLQLPGDQDAFIWASTHTIVVLNTNTAVLMPWLDGVDGVLEAWHDQFNVEPLFEFGFGLSYTTFELTGPIRLTQQRGEVAFGVEVEVKNTGSVAGKETVQLYISIPDSAEPPKLLRGFEKVYLVDFSSRDIVLEASVKLLRIIRVSGTVRGSCVSGHS
jgi:hypothetical protein